MHFASPDAEAAALKSGVGIADASWLGKLELKGRTECVSALNVAEARIWTLARGHALITCNPEDKDMVTETIEQHISKLESAILECSSNSSGAATAKNNVRPEPVEGPSVHGSTGSPRTDLGSASSQAPPDSERSKTKPRAHCLHVADVTSIYAGILLAGPKSRNVLQRLTAPDVSESAFANGACLSAKVAGLHARIVRDDLDETLAYWLFVGTEYAAYAWEAITQTGDQFGIAPVGHEAVEGMRKSEE